MLVAWGVVSVVEERNVAREAGLRAELKWSVHGLAPVNVGAIRGKKNGFGRQADTSR